MPDFLEELTRIDRSGVPMSFHVVAPEQLEIELIQRGIIIIVATWSGAAKVAFSALTWAISHYVRQGIPIYAVDHDLLNPEMAQQKFGIQPEGWGETFWVKQGGIVRRASHFSDFDAPMIKMYTEELLA